MFVVLVCCSQGERPLSPPSTGERSHPPVFSSPPGGPLPMTGRDIPPSQAPVREGRDNADQSGGTRPQEGALCCVCVGSCSSGLLWSYSIQNRLLVQVYTTAYPVLTGRCLCWVMFQWLPWLHSTRHRFLLHLFIHLVKEWCYTILSVPAARRVIG